MLSGLNPPKQAGNRSGSSSLRCVTAHRLPGIDGLRGVAIGLVVFGHTFGSLGPSAASVGVTVFFVLSGFLITSILLAEKHRDGTIDLPAFYARRALRLSPALLALLLVYPLLLWAFDDNFLDGYWSRAGIAALYLSDFFEAAGHPLGALTHTWSLAVEEQFYLVWPAVLLGILALARGDRRRLTQLLGGLVLLTLAWRFMSMVIWSAERVYYGPDTNFYALAAGCLLAVSPALVTRLRTFGPVGAVAILLAAVAPTGGLGDQAAANVLTIGATAASMAVVSLAASQTTVLELKPLRYLGGISYALYLWHLPLLNLGAGSEVPGGGMRLVAVVAAVLLAEVSGRLVERPALRLKRRFERAQIATSAASDGK